MDPDADSDPQHWYLVLPGSIPRLAKRGGGRIRHEINLDPNSRL